MDIRDSLKSLETIRIIVLYNVNIQKADSFSLPFVVDKGLFGIKSPLTTFLTFFQPFCFGF